VGDRAGVGAACGNLGNCYFRMRQYGKAIELHEEDKKIAEEVGDRAGVGKACGNLCRCYAQDGKFDQALTYGNQCYQISRELQLRNEELQPSNLQLHVSICDRTQEGAAHDMRFPAAGALSPSPPCGVQPAPSLLLSPCASSLEVRLRCSALPPALSLRWHRAALDLV